MSLPAAKPTLLVIDDEKQIRRLLRVTLEGEGSGGDGGIGAGMAAAIIIVLLLLIGGGYLVINHSGSSSSVTLDIPKVTVTPPKS